MEQTLPRPRVLVADDHPVVLARLVGLLKERFDVVGAVNDGTFLIEAAQRLRPDAIVTDISMPGLNGIDALRRLKTARSETKVIVLTMHADAALANEAIRAGASGFVVKLLASGELVSAIDQALKGGVYLTAAVTGEGTSGGY